MKEDFKFRIKIVYFLAVFFAVVLATRLFFIQAVKGDYYGSLADKQHISSYGGSFSRGSIYFTEKNGNLISAAVVKNGFQVAINPKILKNPEEVYQKLKNIINLDQDSFLTKAGKKDDPFEVLAKHLDEETAKKISGLKIAGLGVYPESWRYYPSDNMASHLLGFVGYKEDKLVGRYGLEAKYETLLGRNGNGESSVNSFAELFFDFKKLVAGELGIGDIVLTIEPSVQAMLEKTLEKTLEKYKGHLIGGIVVSPKTGEVLAMAAKPDFDPNQYGKAKNFSVFVNPLVESVFEMGSIMKPLTLSASIDNGSISPNTVYDDKGYIDYGSARIKNFDGKARGKVDMQKVLDDSLNTGSVFAMQAMGKDKFREYVTKYGLGEKTGIELPNEVSGKISNIVENKRELEYATASFGQGIAVTPLEMTMALSSLANGGKLMKPFIVKEEKIKGLKNKINEPQEIRQVLKKESADKMTEMLISVFDNALLKGKYKMDHYTIAAKTGTAQFSEGGKGGYKEEEYVHTFFGYAPARDAKFMTFLIMAKPQGVQYASNSLSEPFMDITKFLLNYYEVPPDR